MDLSVPFYIPMVYACLMLSPKDVGITFYSFFFTSHGQHITFCSGLLCWVGFSNMVISWSYLDECSKPQSSPSHKSTLEYCSFIMLSPKKDPYDPNMVYKFTKLTTYKICQAPSHMVYKLTKWTKWTKPRKSAKSPASQFPGPEAQHGCPRGSRSQRGQRGAGAADGGGHEHLRGSENSGKNFW